MVENTIGIIGTGNMGAAIVKTLHNNKVVNEKNIIIYDKDSSVTKEISNQFGVIVAKNNTELVQKSKYILLAVKPQIINEVLKEISPIINPGQIIISIAAGVSLAHIGKFLNENIGIVRIMTNTPLQVGAGASAITNNGKISDESKEFVKEIFNSGGIVVELKEDLIDAVTGLSGSGPAYIFIIIEALADGGVKKGLSRKIALDLAAQTVFGSAKLLIETGKHPGELKDMVTSPGGTTITALHELEKSGLRSTLMRAVEVATEKSKALNKS